MDREELAFASALEQARWVRAGEISPVELVDTYLERIDRLGSELGCYITVAADQARAAALQAERRVRAGGELPPFLGVPISIKDVVDTAGIRTTHGSGAWRDRVPERDAAVVARLRVAGFVILGKASTPEFSGGIYCEPKAFGPCRNPWNPHYTPGGSSGGSGASLAAGLCAASLGSDDGGSIRIPAGWCGVVGLKPSRGRVSAAPAPQAMEFTTGPMTRTVADAAAMLDAIAGYETGDSFWPPPPEHPFLELLGRDPKRLRVAFTTRGADDVEVVPGNVECVERTARVLATLGHELVEVKDWPGRGTFPDERAMPLHAMYGAKYAFMVDAGLMPPIEQLEPTNQLLVEIGRSATAAELLHAQYLAAETSRQLVAFFDEYDTFLTPVMACQPTPVGFYDESPERGMSTLRAIQFTPMFSVSGQPAISVPAGLDADGLPVGVQLAGRPADEATLLCLAAQLEEAQPWRDRRPPLS